MREVAAKVGAPVWLNSADQMLWKQVHPGTTADEQISDGDTSRIGGVELSALRTSGHSPGSTCFPAPALGAGGVIFSADTLFHGGPRCRRQVLLRLPTIITSIRDRLLTLPESTEVLTGHGDATTIAAEKPHLQDWIDRGH